MCDYPKDRPQFFAMKFQKAALRQQLIQEIGFHAFALLVFVATKEDETGYTKPIRWWNQDLWVTLGLTEKSFRAARDKAVASGWLQYKEGTRYTPASYWVQIPPDPTLIETPDAAQPEQLHTDNLGRAEGRQRAGNGEGRGQAEGAPSSLLTYKPNSLIPPIQESQNCCAIPPEEVLTLEKKSEPSGKQKQAKPKKPAYRIEDQVFPKELDTAEFRETWGKWVEFRRSEKKKPVTQTAADMQLGKLAEIGVSAAIETINYSLMNQYLGLFPENFNADSRRPRNGKPDYTRQAVFTPEADIAARGRSVTDFR